MTAAARIIVTRPQPDNAHWVAQLQALGHNALGLPLMDIGPSPHPAAQQAVAQALAHYPQYRALMFVSVNAVRYFFAHPAVVAAGITGPSLAVRCWSPGPGTSAALERAGVAAHWIDAPPANAAQFESETLWAVVRPQVQAGDRVWIVRGSEKSEETHVQDNAPSVQPAPGTGRAWLSEQLQAQGAQAVFAPVYARSAPAATAPWLQQLTALHQQPAYWLLSSSDCLSNLHTLAPHLSWQQHTALATHPRIATQAQALGFGRVLTTRPALDDIHRLLPRLPSDSHEC